MKVGQGDAHSFFERGLAHIPAEFRCVARLAGAEPELSEPEDHVSRFGLSGGLLRDGCLCSDRRDRRPARTRFRTHLRRNARLGRRDALVAHELGAERALRPVLVVGPAPEPDPPYRGLASTGERLDVIELRRSRDSGRPEPPPQIRTGGITASGSCLG